jgi:hypothetical protein
MTASIAAFTAAVKCNSRNVSVRELQKASMHVAQKGDCGFVSSIPRLKAK